MTTDTTTLHAQAARTRAWAASLRAHALATTQLEQTALWHSATGNAFLTRVSSSAGEQRAAARALDEAAAALDAHAHAVTRSMALVAQAEHWVGQTLDRAARAGSPLSIPLPASGSPAWIDLAHRLHNQGW